MAPRAAARTASGQFKRSKTAPPVKNSEGKKPHRRPSRNRLTLVRSLITQWATKLEENSSNTGVTELIRLLALEKELAGNRQEVREIRVTWVEPTVESSKSE